MQHTAQELETIIAEITPRLLAIGAEAAAHIPAPGKWSKQEILGHLIDSAANNHQKFVRGMLATDTTEMPGYEQDAWVATQGYRLADWKQLIGLWGAYNLQLAFLIRNVLPGHLNNRVFVGGQGPYTLEFIMTDYVEHLKHHLLQIMPDSGLKSAFSMSAYA